MRYFTEADGPPRKNERIKQGNCISKHCPWKGDRHLVCVNKKTKVYPRVGCWRIRALFCDKDNTSVRVRMLLYDEEALDAYSNCLWHVQSKVSVHIFVNIHIVRGRDCGAVCAKGTLINAIWGSMDKVDTMI